LDANAATKMATKEVTAIPAEFIMKHPKKFNLKKGDNVQFENVIFECLLDDNKCTDAIKKAYVAITAKLVLNRHATVNWKKINTST
jgi:hypothetical protein